MELPDADQLLARAIAYLEEGRGEDDHVASKMLRSSSLSISEVGTSRDYFNQVQHGVRLELASPRLVCDQLDVFDSLTEAVWEAFRKALPRNLYVSEVRGSYDPTPVAPRRQSRTELTDRQRKVKRLKEEELSNWQIGQRIGFSESTVKREVRELRKRGELP